MIIPTNRESYHSIIFDHVMSQVMKSYAFVCPLDALKLI